MSLKFSSLSRGYGTLDGTVLLNNTPEFEEDWEIYKPWQGNQPIHLPKISVKKITPQETGILQQLHSEPAAHQELPQPSVSQHGPDVSKTFSTRSGALVLFADDGAIRRKKRKRRRELGRLNELPEDGEIDDISVGKFREVIMEFEEDIKDHHLLAKLWGEKLKDESLVDVRPGFSPNRYMASLSKFWDPEMIDRYLSEKKIHSATMKKYLMENYRFPQIEVTKKKDQLLHTKPRPYSPFSLPGLPGANSSTDKDDKTSHSSEFAKSGHETITKTSFATNDKTKVSGVSEGRVNGDKTQRQKAVKAKLVSITFPGAGADLESSESDSLPSEYFDDEFELAKEVVQSTVESSDAPSFTESFLALQEKLAKKHNAARFGENKLPAIQGQVFPKQVGLMNMILLSEVNEGPGRKHAHGKHASHDNQGMLSNDLSQYPANHATADHDKLQSNDCEVYDESRHNNTPASHDHPVSKKYVSLPKLHVRGMAPSDRSDLGAYGGHESNAATFESASAVVDHHDVSVSLPQLPQRGHHDTKHLPEDRHTSQRVTFDNDAIMQDRRKRHSSKRHHQNSVTDISSDGILPIIADGRVHQPLRKDDIIGTRNTKLPPIASDFVPTVPKNTAEEFSASEKQSVILSIEGHSIDMNDVHIELRAGVPPEKVSVAPDVFTQGMADLESSDDDDLEEEWAGRNIHEDEGLDVISDKRDILSQYTDRPFEHDSGTGSQLDGAVVDETICQEEDRDYSIEDSSQLKEVQVEDTVLGNTEPVKATDVIENDHEIKMTTKERSETSTSAVCDAVNQEVEAEKPGNSESNIVNDVSAIPSPHNEEHKEGAAVGESLSGDNLTNVDKGSPPAVSSGDKEVFATTSSDNAELHDTHSEEGEERLDNAALDKDQKEYPDAHLNNDETGLPDSLPDIDKEGLLDTLSDTDRNELTGAHLSKHQEGSTVTCSDKGKEDIPDGHLEKDNVETPSEPPNSTEPVTGLQEEGAAPAEFVPEEAAVIVIEKVSMGSVLDSSRPEKAVVTETNSSGVAQDFVTQEENLQPPSQQSIGPEMSERQSSDGDFAGALEAIVNEVRDITEPQRKTKTGLNKTKGKKGKKGKRPTRNENSPPFHAGVVEDDKMPTSINRTEFTESVPDQTVNVARGPAPTATKTTKKEAKSRRRKKPKKSIFEDFRRVMEDTQAQDGDKKQVLESVPTEGNVQVGDVALEKREGTLITEESANIENPSDSHLENGYNTDRSISLPDERLSDSDTSQHGNTIKIAPVVDAKLQSRKLAAEKRRQEVARRRQEKILEKERAAEEAEREERLKQEAEEEKQRRIEEYKRKREQEELEKRKQEEEENENQRKLLSRKQRDRRQKEDEKKRIEQMVAQLRLEEEMRKERERIAAEIELEMKKKETEMLEKLAADERRIYLEKQKAAEEEQRKLEEEKRQKEEEKRRAEEHEKACIIKKLEDLKNNIRERNAFINKLKQSGVFLSMEQKLSRAFTFSYFDELPWLFMEFSGLTLEPTAESKTNLPSIVEHAAKEE